MTEILRLYNARQTILEMLSDRGINISESLYVTDINVFRKMFYSKDIDILVAPVDCNDKKIFVKFVLSAKIKPNQIKDIIDNIRLDMSLQETDKIILIVKPEPNSNILKVIKEKEYKQVELFCLDRVVFNITKHVLVPKHTKLTEEEVKDVMDKFYIVNKSMFPTMKKDDPIARYFNLSSGDVCRIERFSHTSGHYYSYRVVK